MSCELLIFIELLSPVNAMYGCIKPIISVGLFRPSLLNLIF